ncbi:MAG: dodecin family protein [Thiofilum sp.]|uniref:dodecin family protein n=1 Tax=Thiofilum sp. TaxID=2212733 RepID=UPI0025FFE6A0|nr:dodecin family protein [Thiofilum sp.]MBK8453985.1 dodecin domain-containing protein [Thiofilum sp.]
MSVAKVIELSCTSEKGFDDAIQQGIERAEQTLKGIKSAWVADQTVQVKDGKISEYQVRLKVTFVLE